MLREVYIFNHQIGKGAHPELHEIHEDYSCGCSSSEDLAGLARHLSALVSLSFGRDYSGNIKIRNHASPFMAAYFDTFPLSNFQVQEFERALPECIKPEWVDERNTESYLALLKKFEEIKLVFKKD